ncbi:homeobox-domain-containing protein, partial [Lentinus brumalis]
RKRSRVNPDQLIKLEEFFAADNSPTSARRKDIAQQLGMDERQTQIWFQNRRAKAKLQLKLKTRTVEKLEPPPESPPELASGFDAGVDELIHEDEEVTVFPCTDLTIGTWRRIASPHHDLIAYTCESRRSLSWFIRSAGRSFKMDIFYDHILESRFANISPGIGSATFLLDRPPMFYMESFAEPNPGEEPVRVWQVCGDWTEGMQGTTHLRHCLVGPAYQLSALVNSITPSG